MGHRFSVYFKLSLSSAKGAQCNSLGHRPRCEPAGLRALKARNDGESVLDTHGFGLWSRNFALSALEDFYALSPRAMPWAITFRAFGAGTLTPLSSAIQTSFVCDRFCKLKMDHTHDLLKSISRALVDK